MKQREAVYDAVGSVQEFDDGDRVELTNDERAEVVAKIVGWIEDGSCDFSVDAQAKHNTTEKKTSYVRGLVSNWLRKDLRMNGGEKYTAKNPGSRAGQGDKQRKELRKLLSLHKEDADKAEQIQTFIDKRLAEIKEEKKKDIEIDVEQLPEELRQLA